MATTEESINNALGRQSINDDISKLTEKVRLIQSGEVKNLKVIVGRYIDPVCSNEVLPENHQNGLITYLINLRKRLRGVDEDGVIDWDLLTDAYAPDHLTHLLMARVIQHYR